MLNYTMSTIHYIFFLVLTASLQICHGDQAASTSESTSHASTVGHSHHLYQRYNEKADNWPKSLFWNLVGYCTVLGPIFLFIRMVKYSNFYERNGKGCMVKTIQLCVFGSDSAENSSLESGRIEESAGQHQTTSRLALKLAFCAVGLQIAYLTWGILQERVMTRKYGTGKDARRFTDSEFLVFTNRILAMIVSGFCVSIRRQGKHRSPFYKYSFSSLSNILSSWCQYEALKFVSFPTQVLGKACKMIPVMIMGRIISKKTYQYYEYFTASLLSFGVSLFLLSVATGKVNSTETTISGLVLMIGYMACDSFTSNWQSHLFTQYKLSPTQVMFGTNVFSSVFTCVSLIQNGGMLSSISFIYNHPEFGYHAFVISMASAFGQLFIFYTIGTFGPLVFTSIMVTRQMFSILLSCIIYQHSLAPQAIFGVTIVFIALFLQIYAKWRTKKIQQQKTKNQPNV